MDPDGDEFHDLWDDLYGVFEKHFPHEETKRLRSEAHYFIGVYETWMHDFWQGKSGQGYTVSEALDTLVKKLEELEAAYDNLPRLIKDEFQLRADDVDQRAFEDFEASRDMYFKSEIPPKLARKSIDGLVDLMGNSENAIASIELVRETLPPGIPTMNRPLKEYAVVAACVEIAERMSDMKPWKKYTSSRPGGRFYFFMSEIFELFGPSTSVAGAFNGWRDKIYNKVSDKDLLDIS